MPLSAPIARRLVLITGSTRSGTSLAAGSLHHLGLHVPQPVLRANESNPAGFFESTWPLKFHRRLMDRSHVGVVDARPEAFDLMAAAVSQEQRMELRSWLEGEFHGSSQVVVKDPRSVWVTGLWQETVEALGGRTGFLLMVRHPAEVVASRATYYASGLEGERAWHYRVRNLCGWINLNTGLERDTRDRLRVVTRYEDLLADWRRVAGLVASAFDLDLVLDAGNPRAQAVNSFIDPSLRRHAPTWTGSDLPAALVEIAEGVWSALSDLAEDRPSPEATDRLDALRAAFARQMRIAEAMTPDVRAAAVQADRVERGGVADATPATTAAGPGEHSGGRSRRLAPRWIPRRLRRWALRARG